MAPKIAGGSCLSCGSAEATKLCSACKAKDIVSRYCSRDCQRRNWHEHKLHCGTRAAGAQKSEVKASQSGIATFDMNAVLQNLPMSQGGNPGLSTLFSAKKWWEDLSAERQRERFCMSFQLRNEDAYVYRGEFLGPYNPEGDAYEDFVEYWEMAEGKGLLPESCGREFVESEYARRECGYALEKSDVVEKFGYASGEHMVLRSMAEKITGVATMGDMGGMGF